MERINCAGTSPIPADSGAVAAPATNTAPNTAAGVATGVVSDRDGIDTASPVDTSLISNEKPAGHADRVAVRDESQDPGFFRAVVEIAEITFRSLPIIGNMVNALSAVVRIAMELFDWLSGKYDGEHSFDFAKFGSRLAADLVGTAIPIAGALGHVGLNTWYGATDPQDAELLAGLDEYIGQGSQDSWIGHHLRALYSETLGYFGDDETPSGEVKLTAGTAPARTMALTNATI